jgi:hypothetical protein
VTKRAHASLSEKPRSSTLSGAHVPAWWRGGVFAAATLASVGLFLVSRGKWSDALIDSGNVWIVPDTIARGELLYRDVVYWFGPFTPYVHGFLFRMFGSSYSTLVLAGVIGSLGALAALFFALGRVAPRSEALLWTALAIPALVFMPNSGGAILGMGYRIWHAATFGLLAIAVVSRPPEERRWWNAALGGVLAALAGLCRTEWGLVTLLGTGLAVFIGGEDRRKVWLDELRVAGAFLVVFGGTFGIFALAAGWESFVRDAPVVLANLPAETRSHVAVAGLSAWRDGIWTLVYSAATWLGLFFVVEILALRRADPQRARRRLPWLSFVLVLFALAAWRGAGYSGGLIWSAAPLICAASCLVGLRLRRQPAASALVGFGSLGLLLSHRRLFFIQDAAYVGPPLLFALVCAAGLCSIAVARERDGPSRARLRVGIAVTVLLLAAVAFGIRLFGYGRDDRVPLAGTARLLSARPDMARDIEGLSAAIRADSRGTQGLVVFPEGEVLNFLSRRRNPLRHKLYLPGYLNARNEGEILQELEMSAPAAVVIWRRTRGEYGAGTFGVDYGLRIRRWIAENYDRRSFRRTTSPDTSEFEYYVRRHSK